MRVFRWNAKKKQLIECQSLKGYPCRWYYNMKARHKTKCNGILNAGGKCPKCGWVSALYIDGELRPGYIIGTIDDFPEDVFLELQRDARYLEKILRSRDYLKKA